MTDSQLVETFVSTFHVLDDLMVSRGEHHSGDINSLLITHWDHDLAEWRPRPIHSLSAGLGDLYREIGEPFPPQFEQLVLNFAWAEVDLPGAVYLRTVNRTGKLTVPRVGRISYQLGPTKRSQILKILRSKRGVATP